MRTHKSLSISLLKGAMIRQTHGNRTKQMSLMIQLPSSSYPTQESRAPTASLCYASCSISDNTKKAQMMSFSVLFGHVFRENQTHRKSDPQMSFANQIELLQHYNNEIAKTSVPVMYQILWKCFIIFHLICKHVSLLSLITMKAQSCELIS